MNRRLWGSAVGRGHRWAVMCTLVSREGRVRVRGLLWEPCTLIQAPGFEQAGRLSGLGFLYCHSPKPICNILQAAEKTALVFTECPSLLRRRRKDKAQFLHTSSSRLGQAVTDQACDGTERARNRPADKRQGTQQLLMNQKRVLSVS